MINIIIIIINFYLNSRINFYLYIYSDRNNNNKIFREKKAKP